ncbi:MAG: SDR family oxidoreductase [Kiritimatiellales bacterium]
MTDQVLKNKKAVVTGASRGLGLAIAKAYVSVGANVVMCGRDQKTLSEAVRQVESVAKRGQSVLAVQADVAQEADAERLVDETLSAFGAVDILVNNAGVYGPLGAIEDVDWESWVEAIQINLMGSVCLCRQVVPHMKNQQRGKIIQISGGGATNPLARITAYAASKAAVIRFMESLALELMDFNIDVNAIAPGALNTRMLQEVLAAGPEKVGADFYKKALQQEESGGAPLEKGSELAVYLASSQSDGLTGRLLSAVWDPWPFSAEQVEALKKSDVFTLRRIVTKDRGLEW